MGDIAERVHLHRHPADPPGQRAQLGEHRGKLGPGVPGARPPATADASPLRQREVQGQAWAIGRSSLGSLSRTNLDVLDADRCHIEGPSPSREGTVSWCAKGGADATADVRIILGRLILPLRQPQRPDDRPTMNARLEKARVGPTEVNRRAYRDTDTARAQLEPPRA